MLEVFKTLLLLARPASGKSEAELYLQWLKPEVRRSDFHLWPMLQLDDYQYVEFMREVDRKMVETLHGDHIFYQGLDQPFRDPHEWVTLIELLNEDYRDLVTSRTVSVNSAALHLFQRIDQAELRAGARMKLGRLPRDVLAVLANQLEDRARKLLDRQQAEHSKTLDNSTLVIEFARGGPHGATMPLDPPGGYRYALSRLDTNILCQAVILYFQVSPEVSRAKNFKRAVPPPGCTDTTIYHGVPLSVMMRDYGTCDMLSLMADSDRPSTVRVEADGRTYYLPAAVLNNEIDKTTCLRRDPAEWQQAEVAAIHGALKTACDELWATYSGGTHGAGDFEAHGC